MSYGGPERRHRALTDEDARAIAVHTAQRLVELLSDDTVAEQVIAVWSSHLDRQIGKGVRRLAFYLALALLGLAALKFELLSKLFR